MERARHTYVIPQFRSSTDCLVFGLSSLQYDDCKQESFQHITWLVYSTSQGVILQLRLPVPGTALDVFEHQWNTHHLATDTPTDAYA